MRTRIVLIVALAVVGGSGVTRWPVASAQPQAQTARVAGQSATQLPDGRWLLLGGERAGGIARDAAILEPRTGAIVRLAAAMMAPRAGHTATLLPDGTVLITGGRGLLGQIAPVPELFDPQTSTFVPVAMPGGLSRAGHTATLLLDGRVLIAGGTSGGSGVVPEVEIWDMAAQRVETAGRLRRPRLAQQATLLGDGTVAFSVGSATNEVFDPSTGRSVDGAAPGDDGTPAHVASSMPSDTAIDVGVDVRLALRWSRPLQPETMTTATVTLTGSEGVVDARVVPAEGGRLAFITPRLSLQYGSAYTLTIAGATDRAGQPISASMSFTTMDDPHPLADAQSDQETWVPGDRSRRESWKTERPPSSWESLAPLMAPPGTTAISGRVLALDGRPLPGVSLGVEGGDPVRSDRTGRFLLTLDTSATARRVLHIDGAPASRGNRRYGFFEYGSIVVAGRTNVLPFTIWMPKLDLAHQVSIASPTTGEVVVTTPFIPGLELHLPPGTTIVGRDGKPVKTVGITAIPVDRPPFPLAKNVDVPVYFTVQPGGAYVKTSGAGPKGAWLVYPNYRQAPIGKRVQFFHYDPDVRDWYVYGPGTVMPGGAQVMPDPKTRIYEFTGAMINSGPSPPNDAPPPDDCPCGKDGDPVDLNTGLFTMETTDLYLTDVLPISVTRSYRQRDVDTRAFGVGMTHPYAMFMYSEHQYSEADLVLPDGARIHYVRTSPGTGWTDAVFVHQETATTTATPTSFYKSSMIWNGNGWDVTLKDGSVYVFGENAPLQAVRDRFGNQITVAHAGGQAGNVTQVTSPNGRWIAFTYDGSNRVTQAKDNMGRTVAYTYDGAGNLATVTDPEAHVTSYTYDASHAMLTMKTPTLQGTSTNLVTNEYTTAADAPTPVGWVKKQTHADGGIFLFSYTVAGGKSTQTDVTDPRGFVRRVTFNAAGYLLTDTRALGQPEQQVTASTRQAGTNLVTNSTDASGSQTAQTYDANGNVLTATSRAGSPDATTITYTYEPRFNQVATQTDALSHTTTSTYDELGRLSTITDPLNHQTTYTYNQVGQITSVTDAMQHTTTYEYKMGDLVKITDPLQRVATRYVDAAGRVAAITDASGRTVRQTYDRNDQVTKVVDAGGAETLFAYDAEGGLTSVTDARQHQTMYTRDAMGRAATRVDPLQRVESFAYDLAGNPTQRTDQKGQVIGRQYDARDRLHQITFADSSSITYTYDTSGRVTQAVDSLWGTATRTYDNYDRVTSEATPQGSIAYTYDVLGRRATMTVTGQTALVYAYDAADRLTSVTQGTAAVTIGYDDLNRRTSLTLPNGVVTEYGYDDASQLTSLTYRLGPTVLGTLTYGYDASGNRTTVSGSWARAGLPQPVASAVYDAANQMTQFGATSYSYDPNGSLISDGLNSMTWNPRNQLTAIAGAGSASFQYDPNGLRTLKTLGGVTTTTLNDGIEAVQDVVGASTINRLTGSHVDERWSRSDGTSTVYPLVDGLGSTVAVTDPSGNLSGHMAYEPYGRASAFSTAPADAYQFTGRENDGDFYYYRNRYYDSSTGRFISADPIGFKGGLNLYAYADQNPIGASDPEGLTVGTNWTFFWDWAFDRGSDSRTYGQGTVEIAEMRTSPGATKMRNEFKAGNCKSRKGYFGTIEAYFKTAWMVNSTAAQVGGFVYTAVNNGNGTVTYTITNRAGAYSFFLHFPLIPKRQPRASQTIHVFGDINQVFSWTEKSPCCQSR